MEPRKHPSQKLGRCAFFPWGLGRVGTVNEPHSKLPEFARRWKPLSPPPFHTPALPSPNEVFPLGQKCWVTLLLPSPQGQKHRVTRRDAASRTPAQGPVRAAGERPTEQNWGGVCGMGPTPEPPKAQKTSLHSICSKVNNSQQVNRAPIVSSVLWTGLQRGLLF